MKIDTKFDVGESVWVMFNNKPMELEIDEIKITVSNGLKCETVTTFYRIGSDYYIDGNMYKTKKDLIDSL